MIHLAHTDSLFDIDMEVLASIPPWPAYVPVSDLAMDLFDSGLNSPVTQAVKRLQERGFGVRGRNVVIPGDFKSSRVVTIDPEHWPHCRDAATSYMDALYPPSDSGRAANISPDSAP